MLNDLYPISPSGISSLLDTLLAPPDVSRWDPRLYPEEGDSPRLDSFLSEEGLVDWTGYRLLGICPSAVETRS